MENYLEERLREYIRERIQKDLPEIIKEISTTGGVAGYLTPKAFVGDKHSNIEHQKQIAKRIGYSLTTRGEKDTKPGDKLTELEALDEIRFSTMTPNAFRHDFPENIKKIEELSHLHDHTMTERGKKDHARPSDPRGDEHRTVQSLLKLSERGDYTFLPSEDLEATGVKDSVYKKGKSATGASSNGIGFSTIGENYYAYRNDVTALPHQKIGRAISEVSRQLALMERALRMNYRLQKECGVTNDVLWKRTKQQMLKLEGRLISLAGKLREMRG